MNLLKRRRPPDPHPFLLSLPLTATTIADKRIDHTWDPEERLHRDGGRRGRGGEARLAGEALVVVVLGGKVCIDWVVGSSEEATGRERSEDGPGDDAVVG
jgi:hypothetical protein